MYRRFPIGPIFATTSAITLVQVLINFYLDLGNGLQSILQTSASPLPPVYSVNSIQDQYYKNMNQGVVLCTVGSATTYNNTEMPD